MKHTELADVRLFPGGTDVEDERCSRRGRLLPEEWVRYPDPLTGRTVIRFTASDGTDQHPYFTGPAVTADGQRLVVISDRTGNPNLYSLDLGTGELLQLTDNRYGVLRQYVFPWGNRVGFGKSSVSMCAATGDIYYMQGRQIRRVNAYTARETCIAELPPGWVTAFTHVSSDNALLCVPIVPEEAFAGATEALGSRYGSDGFREVERRVRERGLKSLLWVVATDGSRQSVWAEQGSWITHVQFRPGDNRYLMFNNEGIGDRPGGQRIWMCDSQTGDVWKIRPEPEDVEFWNCHEVWTEDGREILYHGSGPHPETGERLNFYGFSDLSGENCREYYLSGLDVQPRSYGHFAEHPGRDCAYCDGFIDMSLITEVRPRNDGYVNWQPICRHDTNWLGQDDHPHPIMTPDRSMLIFSSSVEGTGNVYGVRL